jgi:DNA (cytosine-5)-methyltransferase 1
MHRENHPQTRHYTADVFSVSPVAAVAGGRVGLLWASPDCTHFSRAKGGKPVAKDIRSLAWVVVTWARLVRPRVIILENVSEFRTWGPLDSNNRPDPVRAGTTFILWANRLRGLGYTVEFRDLVAADYGAPTIRKRLFMIARCDGRPIVWPKPTHGTPGNAQGLPPHQAAAECIEWSLPCPSIFERKRPLADNTLWRIARGIRRYVLEAQEPFIVRIGHYSNKTGAGASFRGQSLVNPLATVCSVNDKALVLPYLSTIDHRNSNGACVQDVTQPLTTITMKNRFALVSAFLAKYYTDVVGSDVRKPNPTVTAIDHNALVTAHLTKFYGKSMGSDMREPLPTITSVTHLAEVRAFLVKYFGTAIGQGLDEPVHTLTAKHRFGLVTVEGQKYQIADIGLRMLQPRELARTQGFPDNYVLNGTKTNQVAKIGNSVCPPIARQLVLVNVNCAEAQGIKAV